MLDAFDFFLLVFMIKAIGEEFGADVEAGLRSAVPDPRRAAARRAGVRLARRPVRPAADPDDR